ncbi:MAG: PHP domain-containing protein, partial [Bacilli bacterium]
MNYIPLHVYSGYSFLSSALKVEDIIANSIKKNLPYVAISDYNNASIFPSLSSQA